MRQIILRPTPVHIDPVLPDLPPAQISRQTQLASDRLYGPYQDVREIVDGVVTRLVEL